MKYNNTSLQGKWRMITRDGLSLNNLSIERTKETYKCVWMSGKERYIGIGIVFCK